jgi:hypothetical protein
MVIPLAVMLWKTLYPYMYVLRKAERTLFSRFDPAGDLLTLL